MDNHPNKHRPRPALPWYRQQFNACHALEMLGVERQERQLMHTGGGGYDGVNDINNLIGTHQLNLYGGGF